MGLGPTSLSLPFGMVLVSFQRQTIEFPRSMTIFVFFWGPYQCLSGFCFDFHPIWRKVNLTAVVTVKTVAVTVEATLVGAMCRNRKKWGMS